MNLRRRICDPRSREADDRDRVPCWRFLAPLLTYRSSLDDLEERGWRSRRRHIQVSVQAAPVDVLNSQRDDRYQARRIFVTAAISGQHLVSAQHNAVAHDVAGRRPATPAVAIAGRRRRGWYARLLKGVHVTEPGGAARSFVGEIGRGIALGRRLQLTERAKPTLNGQLAARLAHPGGLRRSTGLFHPVST